MNTQNTNEEVNAMAKSFVEEILDKQNIKFEIEAGIDVYVHGNTVMVKHKKPDTNEELKKYLIEQKLPDGTFVLPYSAVSYDKKKFNALVQAIEAYYAGKIAEERVRAAQDIFNLAHAYADQDETMVGAAELRAYHYFNAIHKVGGFQGR